MLKKVMWGSRLKYRNFHLEELRLESARSLPKPTVFRRMTCLEEKREGYFLCLWHLLALAEFI